MPTLTLPGWCRPEGLRIWRAPLVNAQGDELLHAADTHTDEVLARIAGEGFTGVWFFALLYDVMDSTVFPELNRPLAAERRAALRTVIARARRHGIAVYLYFNDPVGIPVDHPFWQTHPELRGHEKWRKYALCTSAPPVLPFVRQAIGSVLDDLPGLGGVILITACEDLTHCWSKCPTRRGAPPTTCPRCAAREPADLVLELIALWAEAAARQPRPCRVLAWNWEWAYWYDDPPRAILDRLPPGVELLLDIEIGGHRTWLGKPSYIGEYSLAYAGPSERFIAAAQAAGTRPIHAKLQLNNTHELCAVPNLPVLHTLHAKFVALLEWGAAGFLGTWTIGLDFTLNTAALRLFLTAPATYRDRDRFLADLARGYLGVTDPAPVLAAWAGFSAAFALQPFSVSLLYFGPHNDAPGRPLSFHYRGQPTGRSYGADPMGDDLAPALKGAVVDQEAPALDDIVSAYAQMATQWETALLPYATALATSPRAEAQQELRTARMIAHHLRSLHHIWAFYRETVRLMREHQLTAPCDLPRTPALVALLEAEMANTAAALPLVESDARFGRHQEFQGAKYTPASLRQKLAAMAAELTTAP
jgi:hypothetical protein